MSKESRWGGVYTEQNVRDEYPGIVDEIEKHARAKALWDAARAVCTFCEVRIPLNERHRGQYEHGKVQCGAHAIRRLAEREGISTEDW